MPHLIEFPLEGGGSVVVEVTEPVEGMIPAATPGEVVAKADQTFEAALDRVRPAAQAILRKLRSLEEPPDQVQVEFSIKMNLKAGAVVASAGAEANYKVTLTWKQQKSPTST